VAGADALQQATVQVELRQDARHEGPVAELGVDRRVEPADLTGKVVAVAARAAVGPSAVAAMSPACRPCPIASKIAKVTVVVDSV